MRILAVDDDPFIQELMPIIFREARFPRITVVGSGEEALALLQVQKAYFDCLLLDIMMPDMDGIELCGHIRKLEQYKSTPILMLTSKSDIPSIERAFVAGANDYITKPFDVKEIGNRVRIAQRLLKATDDTALIDPLAADEDMQPGRHIFQLEDAVRLPEIDQLVLPFSLGNYLSQLSRASLQTCQIFATRVDHAEHLYKTCTTTEFAALLMDVSHAISEVVDCKAMLVSYEGNATFLSIAPVEHLPTWPEIEDEIERVLAREAGIFANGVPQRITLSVGSPMHPNASRTQRVKKTFERAISRVAMRQKVKFPELDLEATP